jgi:hypothetical protein
MKNPEVTQAALAILRKGEPFNWTVIAFLAIVVYIYFNEISKGNWKSVAAGLSLYMVHWFYEIMYLPAQPTTEHIACGRTDTEFCCTVLK